MIKITQRHFNDNEFLLKLYEAYKIFVCRQNKKLGNQIAISDILFEYVFLIQDKKFRTNPIKSNYKEYGRVLFREIIDELKCKRVLRLKDVLSFDKGFYAYRSYLVGINEYKIVPLIFPRSNFKLEILDGLLSYPLSIFSLKNLKGERRLFKALKAKLMNLLQNWKGFNSVRSSIEDIFKLAK